MATRWLALCASASNVSTLTTTPRFDTDRQTHLHVSHKAFPHLAAFCCVSRHRSFCFMSERVTARINSSAHAPSTRAVNVNRSIEWRGVWQTKEIHAARTQRDREMTHVGACESIAPDDENDDDDDDGIRVVKPLFGERTCIRSWP